MAQASVLHTEMDRTPGRFWMEINGSELDLPDYLGREVCKIFGV